MAKRIAVDRKTVVEAIRGATRKLGRPPKRGELPRVAGISYSALLAHFSSIREGVRAAGLEPVQKGMKIPEEALLADWMRVRDKLGKVPDRADYTQHGRYSITTMCLRFGGWTKVPLYVQRLEAPDPNGPTSLQDGRVGPAIDRRAPDPLSAPAEANGSDKAIAMQWATTVPALPGDLAGKRRVTDAICAMIVNTLMGDEVGSRCRPIIMGESPPADRPPVKTENPGFAVAAHNGSVALVRANGHEAAPLARLNGSVTSGGVLDGERPVMGPPFDRSVLTNAPINEFGVVFLFGMLAGELGFQVESLRGDFPDCEARRQIQPGKWQRVRIEFEYESRNFAHHGHDPAACDVIVCWKHNWVKCPGSIEVIALNRILQCARSGEHVG